MREINIWGGKVKEPGLLFIQSNEEVYFPFKLKRRGRTGKIGRL